MSTVTAPRRVSRTLASPRAVALGGVALLTLGYLSTLYEIMGEAGVRSWLLAAVGVGLVAAVVASGQSERRVLPAAVALGALGLIWYGRQTLQGVGAEAVWSGLIDTTVLLSGVSVRQMAATELWVAAVVPVPVFLSTYFALRRRYVLATVAGGSLALLLAMTGDAVSFDTLVSVVGATTAVGFGELDRRGGSVASGDVLVVLIAVMAVLALQVTFVPTGQAATLSPSGSGTGGGAGGSGGDATALDDQLLSGTGVQPSGSVSLSPEVQFVVTAEEPRRWRVGVLDRYDGNGWYSTGRTRSFGGNAIGPPGETRTVTQRVELESATQGSLPHAAEPVAVEGLPQSSLRLSDTGVLKTTERLEAGTTYTVQSEVPDATEAELRAAGSDYPALVEERYTRLPSDVPDRVAERTEQVTSQAESDYERAVAVEAYLQDAKEYSLEVEQPEGPLVDTFLFRMDAGYCTYFAASMATMLRTQDVPARVAVGYGPGQAVDDDTRVVRGTDAHAWVEVYVPDVGWVEFDPTPGAQWEQVHGSAIEDARAAGVEGVDVAGSENESAGYQSPSDLDRGASSEDADADGDGEDTVVDPNDAPDVTGVNDSDQPYVDPEELLVDDAAANETASSDESSGPTRLLEGLEELLFAGFLLGGTLAGAHRLGLTARLGRTAGLFWQRRVDPETDVRRALDRLELLLERQHGPRRAGETPREYADRLPASVDDRVRRAYRLHEAARYSGEPDEAAADELVALVDQLTRESVPVLGRFVR